jgi:hypothetical protein
MRFFPSMSYVVATIATDRCAPQLVAIHTGIHINFFFLPQGVAVLHWTVANLTFYFSVGVFWVAEVNKSG